MDFMEHLSKKELLEIYDKINRWEWDDRLGEKPVNFDEMPNRDKGSKFQKYFVLMPYFKEIKKRTSERERAKYHHLHKLKRSRFQFEVWWAQRLFRTKILGYPF
jgi:hypothetical protein